MALWGSSTTDRKKPLFQANTADPARNAVANTYADNTGWQYTRPDGTVENIVAIRGLAGLIGNANITQAYFESESNLDAGVSSNVVVVYNEKVIVLGTTVPKVNITCTGSSVANILASLVSGNNTNQLKFEFTTLNDFAGNTNANVAMTLANQVILIAATNNIVDHTDTTSNASRSIPYYTGFEYGFNGAVPGLSIVHSVPVLSNVKFAGNVANTVNSNVFANFTGTVYNRGALGTIQLQNAANAAQTIVATLASGNGSSNLRFSWTAPGWPETVVFTNNQVIITTGTLVDSANAGVANTITIAISVAAGNVSVT